MIIAVILFFLMSAGINKENKAVSQLNRGGTQQSVKLEAEFEYEDKRIVIAPTIRVLAEGAENENEPEVETKQDDWLQTFAERLVKSLNKNSEGSFLVLPTEKDGVKITWILPKEAAPYWIFAFAVFLSLLIYFSRYDSFKKQERIKKESFDNELPKMIFSFILLLNAGLVTEQAFNELLMQNESSKNPLYEFMRRIKTQSETENIAFVNLLYSYAVSYSNRDFLRFAGLIYENSSRGAELVQKLEAESDSSYNSKMLSAKAKVNKAETKLCFPLVLLLLSLVIICIAPAMIIM